MSSPKSSSSAAENIDAIQVRPRTVALAAKIDLVRGETRSINQHALHETFIRHRGYYIVISVREARALVGYFRLKLDDIPALCRIVQHAHARDAGEVNFLRSFQSFSRSLQ